MSIIEYPKFLLFGDSLTQHSTSTSTTDPRFSFFAELSHTYSRRFDIINRGFSGYNTAQALQILPHLIPPPSPTYRLELITIFFGANDAVLPGQFQHIPQEVYKANLTAIVTHPVIQAHSPKIIVITPPPICEYKTQLHDQSRERTDIQRLAVNTREYGNIARQVAKDTRVECLDLWTVFMNYAGWKDDGGKGEDLIGAKVMAQSEKLDELLDDGLHFTGKGYRVFYDALMKLILKTWPGLNPEKMPFVFPAWEVAPMKS